MAEAMPKSRGTLVAAVEALAQLSAVTDNSEPEQDCVIISLANRSAVFVDADIDVVELALTTNQFVTIGDWRVNPDHVVSFRRARVSTRHTLERLGDPHEDR